MPVYDKCPGPTADKGSCDRAHEACYARAVRSCE